MKLSKSISLSLSLACMIDQLIDFQYNLLSLVNKKKCVAVVACMWFVHDER